jgi:hypothetical protein
VATASAGSEYHVRRARPLGGKVSEVAIGGWSQTPAVGSGGRAYFATDQR